MTTEIIRCIHGMEYDTCSICCEMDVEKIKEEVERTQRDFSWREPVAAGSGGEIEEIEYDFDYDIDVDSE